MFRSRAEVNPESELKLKEVRKELWKGGAKGLLLGASIGYIGHSVIAALSPQMKHKMNKNTLLAGVLLSASVFSFVSALANGKNSVPYIGDFFKQNLRQDVDSEEEKSRRRNEAITRFQEERRNNSNGK